MRLHLSRVQLGAIGGGAALLMTLWMCGRFSDSPVVRIEFGADADQFEGLEVLIDGRVVGKLRRSDQATLSGFEIRKGTHHVCVQHPQYGCSPTRVTADKPGQELMLRLEYEEVTEPRGASRIRLALRG
jgi:hypothetical protein